MFNFVNDKIKTIFKYLTFPFKNDNSYYHNSNTNKFFSVKRNSFTSEKTKSIYASSCK